MTFIQNLFSIRPQAGVDREYLTGVKRGFDSSGVGIGLDLLMYMLIILLFLIVVVLLLRLVVRPAKQKFGPGRVDDVKSPGEIRKIIERSVTLRAAYDMEVFHESYKETYKGQVLGINPDNEIEVELTAFIDPNLDFLDQDVRVNFRMSRRGEAEFYQFDTQTRNIGTTTAYGRREKAVRLAIPSLVEKGQKRRHLRVHPAGRFSFQVDIVQPHLPANPIPIQGFRRLHRAVIHDVSVGGMQAMLQARSSEIKVRPGQEAYVHFKPPTGNLPVDNLPRNYFAKVKIITVIREASGRRLMSRESDENTIGPHMIRMEFISKGAINLKEKNVSFRPATTLAFEDLARWVQAYQRHRIQEAKGTLAKPNRVRNIYPTSKPDVNPKYPPKPLKRNAKE